MRVAEFIKLTVVRQLMLEYRCSLPPPGGGILRSGVGFPPHEKWQGGSISHPALPPRGVRSFGSVPTAMKHSIGAHWNSGSLGSHWNSHPGIYFQSTPTPWGWEFFGVPTLYFQWGGSLPPCLKKRKNIYNLVDARSHKSWLRVLLEDARSHKFGSPGTPEAENITE